jgi:hypothetical protein
MSKQKIAQNNTYNAPDQPAPFTNGIDSDRRIPEGQVYSGQEKHEWKLGYHNVKISSGFMEKSGHGPKKESTSYLDSNNPDPNKPAIRKPTGIKDKDYNIGIDYVVDGDKKVFPWYGGKVKKAEWTGAYGNQVVVQTNQVYQYNGKKYPIITAYSHLASINVKEGDPVYTNSNLGKMGGTGGGSVSGEHVDFQSYIIVNNKKIQLSPNLMQDNLKQQEKEGTFNYNVSSTRSNNSDIASNKTEVKTASAKTTDSTAEAVQTDSIDADSTKFQSYDSGMNNTQAESSKLGVSKTESATASEKGSKNDVLKVISLIQENADAVKQQYGLDVTTSDGLGKAVMQYWKENNLDPKALKEQLPNVKGSDIDAALATATKTTTVGSTKAKQAEAQRQ